MRQRTALDEDCFVGDLARTQDWSAAFEEVDVVVHLAARVHVMSDKCSDPLAEFRRVNADGTATFARQAAETGMEVVTHKLLGWTPPLSVDEGLRCAAEGFRE